MPQKVSATWLGFWPLLVALSIIIITTTTNGVFAHVWDEPVILDEGQPRIQPKIAGGTLASEGDFPWYISPTLGHFCGASLIHPDVALTAAHCGQAFAERADVYVGALVRGTPAGGAVLRRIKRVYPHPLYNEESEEQENDIMLFLLDEPVPVEQVQPVVYNTNPNLPMTNEPVIVMGFGKTAADEDPTFDLRRTSLFATDDDTCADIYLNLFDQQLMICAGDPDNPTSACQGDSGSPLISVVENEQDGVPIQYGVVSFGLAATNDGPVNACGNPDIPTVYVRVSSYANWITAGICALSETPPADTNCFDLPEIILPSLAPTPASPAPTPAPLASTLTFLVQFDANPDETDFYIMTADTGRMVAARPGTPVNPYTKVSYGIDNFPHGSFVFVLVDSGRDGMTSGVIPGYVDIFQHVENAEGNDDLVLIAYGDPDFEILLEISFNVTEFPVEVFRPTPAPTAFPTTLPTRSPAPTTSPTKPAPTLVPTNAPPPGSGPSIGTRPSAGDRDDDDDDDDEEEEEKDLLGLGLDETTSLIVVAAIALVALVLFVIVVRCLCCSPKAENRR